MKNNRNRMVMRRVLGLLPFYLFAFLPLYAQPSWVKKAAKSVFTVKTFDANGSLIGSSNGFFVGSNGEAMSSFSPFKGASRREATHRLTIGTDEETVAATYQ